MDPNCQTTVLLILASEKSTENLKVSLQPLNVDVVSAHDLQRARDRVREDRSIDVVVTDVTLPDGNWSDVLRYIVEESLSANMVVCTPVADEHLWSEVLWRGGYDILLRPYQAEQARRVVEGALRSSFSTALKPLQSEASSRRESLAAAASVH